eukprot:scaffold24174_cov127-Isochrysis_galbana.AAC.9
MRPIYNVQRFTLNNASGCPPHKKHERLRLPRHRFKCANRSVQAADLPYSSAAVVHELAQPVLNPTGRVARIVDQCILMQERAHEHDIDTRLLVLFHAVLPSIGNGALWTRRCLPLRKLIQSEHVRRERLRHGEQLRPQLVLH